MIKKCIITMLLICLVPASLLAESRIVLYGDSLMAGYGLTQKHHLSTILENNLISQGINVKVINASVSGDTSAGGLNRLNWILSEDKIDLFILGLGANDMLRGISPEETENNLEKIIQKVSEKNINLILAGMIAPKSHGKDYKNKFDLIYKNLSAQFNLKLVPFLLEGVALNPDLNLEDGIHPNERGILIVSKNLEKKILEILN
tara:strand:+ start:411 stop:1022 length:612 start_codon:yes stop_codon:yes gene_type:complete